MKANRKFFNFSFVLNFILAAIGFGIVALVSALSSKAIVGYIVCWVLFLAVAVLINTYIVKRIKLKPVYSIFGIAVNALFLVAPSVLLLVL